MSGLSIEELRKSLETDATRRNATQEKTIKEQQLMISSLRQEIAMLKGQVNPHFQALVLGVMFRGIISHKFYGLRRGILYWEITELNDDTMLPTISVMRGTYEECTKRAVML